MTHWRVWHYCVFFVLQTIFPSQSCLQNLTVSVSIQTPRHLLQRRHVGRPLFKTQSLGSELKVTSSVRKISKWNFSDIPMKFSPLSFVCSVHWVCMFCQQFHTHMTCHESWPVKFRDPIQCCLLSCNVLLSTCADDSWGTFTMWHFLYLFMYLFTHSDKILFGSKFFFFFFELKSLSSLLLQTHCGFC